MIIVLNISDRKVCLAVVFTILTAGWTQVE